MKYLRDLQRVVRPLRIHFIVLLLALLALAFNAQGHDIIYCIIEDNINHQTFPMISLFVALVFLSFSTSLTMRIKLWVSDISSDGLSTDRSEKRRYYARVLPQLGMYLPVYIVHLAFMCAYAVKEMSDSYILMSGVVVMKVILLITTLKLKRNRSQLLFTTPWFTAITFFSCLYFSGIFFYLLIFDGLNEHLIFFINLTLLSVASIAVLRYIHSEWIVAYIIRKVKEINPNYSLTPLKPVINNIHDRKEVRAIIRMNAFIVKPFVLYVLTALLLITGMNILPIHWFEIIGGAAIILLSLTCWLLVYGFVSAYSRTIAASFAIGIKTILLGLLIYASFLNNDHPIRIRPPGETDALKNTRENAPGLVEYFDRWFEEKYGNTDSGKLPVVFIAAEGGAFRTGCYSAFMLNQISRQVNGFSDKIFCYSTVSGGSFGCNLYNSLKLEKLSTDSVDKVLQAFFSRDYLSPLGAKLMFGEILGYFWRGYVSSFDRAAALELSWEYGLKHAGGNGYFESDFATLNSKPGNALMLINTTEVNTGRRYIISNIAIHDSVYHTAGDFMKLLNSTSHSIAYSTAIGLSARFPLLSPAGTIKDGNNNKYQFVDGGYYENKGASTLDETIAEIMRHSKYRHRIKPIVIQFSFGDTDDPNKKQGISKFNELSEILAGIYNVRGGHAQHAYRNLILTTNAFHGKFVEFSPMQLSKNQLPMNWVLSYKAVNHVRRETRSNDNTIKIEQNIKPYFK